MVKRNAKNEVAKEPENQAAHSYYKVKCKRCGHNQSLPGFSREEVEEWAENNDCDDCADKKHEEWKTTHYAWMKAYNEKKRAAKIEEERKAKAAKKASKSAETKKKKGKGVGKRKSAGVITS